MIRCLGFILILVSITVTAQTFPLPPAGDNVVGQVQVVFSKSRDDFNKIAQRYDLGYYELVEANPGINPENAIPAGTLIILPTQFILPNAPRKGIVINLAELRLYYYPVGQNVVMTYPVGIGREGWSTPLGVTSITNKRENPTWTPTPAIRKWRAEQGVTLPDVVPAGPENPLGLYAMNLGWPAYLMHGTNDPSGVGRRSSSGCIRLYPSDIEALFAMATVGMRVEVVNAAYKVGFLGPNEYLESHLPLQENSAEYSASYLPLVDTLNAALQQRPSARIDWSLAEKASDLHSGIPIMIGKIQ